MAKLTPMMAQYKEIKSQYPDCVLMFRLGDFYEMFLEDAEVASKILQITLTARGKGETQTPMCGIPFHALDQYLWKLTKAGKKVAICDQVTVPDGKGIVQREVVRVVTPGTTFDDKILEGGANNYVAAVVEDRGRFGFAFADVTTGDFKVSEFENVKELIAEVGRVKPAECICDQKLMGLFGGIHTFPYDYSLDAAKSLKENFEVQSLQVFGLEEKNLAVSASGMLLEYLKETQKTELNHIQKISFYELSDFMPLDESCIRNLELFFTNRDGQKEGSLIWVLDNTLSAMGGRLLRNWLLHPLLSKSQIEARHEKVETLVGDSSLMRAVRENLDKLYDMERLLSRLSLGTGNAKDLIAMKESLKVVPLLKNLITENLPELNKELFDLSTLVELVERAIADEAPTSMRDGGMIRKGFDQALDDLRAISTEGKTFIKDLQEREAARTGISTLKVKFNKVFGYYIEVSKANSAAVPDDYIRKQTLVNAERYITPELKEYEEKVLTAEDKIKELEYELFYKVRLELLKEIVKIQKTAKALAELDVLSTFAFNAEKFGYVRPKIVEGKELKIVNGRHPVIEKIASDFIPNDCDMNSENDFLLITGPNMGGKSTYLRQVALTALMAQIGSFVAAEKVLMGVVDRIFTRVGASDNLVRGESTFMVEMQEAAYILNNATAQSLIIFDEVGRGTSTYDGVSIAWAITEFVHDKIEAKTIFATHYHELIELADKLDRACNMSVAIRENEQEGVVFLYKVVEGGVDKSYGIEVAKLAGLPVDIVGRARGVLNELENKHIGKNKINPDQTAIFTPEPRAAAGLDSADKKLLDELKEMNVNEMTPMQALQKLSEIKQNF